MKNWVKRALRTFAQAVAGYVAIALPTLTVTDDISVMKTALIGVGVSAVASGISAVVNAIEDKYY